MLPPYVCLFLLFGLLLRFPLWKLPLSLLLQQPCRHGLDIVQVLKGHPGPDEEPHPVPRRPGQHALAGQGAEPGLDVIKVTVEQVRGLVAERLGVEKVSVDWLRAKMADWIYLAQFDAFYHIHGDTLMRNVTCDSGTWEADGSLLVDCRCSDLEIGRVVRLYPKEGGGYRIGYIRAPGG